MLKEGRESTNIEDRRGMSGKGFAIGGGGCFTLILALVVLFLGGDPSSFLRQAQQDSVQVEQNQPVQSNQQEDAQKKFASIVLATTEDSWRETFRRSGVQYRDPKLVLFRGQVQSACGAAGSSTGPFYCPADQKLYLDFAFFDELRNEFKAPGDFAQAYVIAHEVGHHVQKQLGVLDDVQEKRQQLSEKEANKLTVRLELQADFYAGIWAYHAQQKFNILEPGDIEEALGAASAVGDDHLQMQSQGRVVPDAFTHGTSEQRMKWFKKGWDTGDPGQGDTFSRGAV